MGHVIDEISALKYMGNDFTNLGFLVLWYRAVDYTRRLKILN